MTETDWRESYYQPVPEPVGLARRLWNSKPARTALIAAAAIGVVVTVFTTFDVTNIWASTTTCVTETAVVDRSDVPVATAAEAGTSTTGPVIVHADSADAHSGYYPNTPSDGCVTVAAAADILISGFDLETDVVFTATITVTSNDADTPLQTTWQLTPGRLTPPRVTSNDADTPLQTTIRGLANISDEGNAAFETHHVWADVDAAFLNNTPKTVISEYVITLFQAGEPQDTQTFNHVRRIHGQ